MARNKGKTEMVSDLRSLSCQFQIRSGILNQERIREKREKTKLGNPR